MPRNYYWKGKKHKPETIKKISESRMGSDNPAWRGDKASYASIHRFVRKRKSIPNKCEICNKENEWLDLANITGIYTRNLEDYKYMCRSCHMKSDGRLERLHETKRKPIKPQPETKLPSKLKIYDEKLAQYENLDADARATINAILDYLREKS